MDTGAGAGAAAAALTRSLTRSLAAAGEELRVTEVKQKKTHAQDEKNTPQRTGGGEGLSDAAIRTPYKC